MMKLVRKFRDHVTEVRYLYGVVPMDHEDTVFKQQVLVSLVIFISLLILVLWLLPTLSKSGEALLLPLLVISSTSYGLGQLFYIERMYRLIKRFAPGSFSIPVAPASF